MAAGWRRGAYRVHAWLGLASSLLVVLVSLTGAPLVFRHEIDAWLAPERPRLLEHAPLPVDQAVAAVLARRPGAVPASVSYPRDAYGRPDPAEPLGLVLRLRDGRSEMVSIGLYDGRELRQPDFRLGQFLRDIHVRLYLLKPGWLYALGHVLVGLLGVAMVVSAVTGLLFHRHLLRDMLRLRIFHSRRLLLSDLHRLAGLWLLAFHLAVAVSGAVISTVVLPGIYRQLAGAQAAPPAVSAMPQPSLPLAAIERIAARELPGAAIMYVRFPARSDAGIVVWLNDRSPWIRQGASRIVLDASGGVVREVVRAGEASWPVRIYNLMWPLHFGTFGGLPVKIAYAVFGLVSALLGITGLLIWRERTFRQRRTKKPGTGRALS